MVREALKTAPGDIRLSFMLAQAQRDAGDPDGAEATARRCRKRIPTICGRKFLLAQMLDANRRHQAIVDLCSPDRAQRAPTRSPADRAC